MKLTIAIGFVLSLTTIASAQRTSIRGFLDPIVFPRLRNVTVENGVLAFGRSSGGIAIYERRADGIFRSAQVLEHSNRSAVVLVRGRLIVFPHRTEEAVVYQRVSGVWSRTQTLAFPYGSTDEVSVDGNVVVIGRESFTEPRSNLYALRVADTVSVERVGDTSSLSRPNLYYDLDGDVVALFHRDVGELEVHRYDGRVWRSEYRAPMPRLPRSWLEPERAPSVRVRGDIIHLIDDVVSKRLHTDGRLTPWTFRYDRSARRWRADASCFIEPVDGIYKLCRHDEVCRAGTCDRSIGWPVNVWQSGLESGDTSAGFAAGPSFTPDRPRALHQWDGERWVAGTAFDVASPARAVDSTTYVAAPGENRLIVISVCFEGGCVSLDASVGSVCVADAHCESGFCVDGVCCDARCDDTCSACDVAESIGACSGVTGAPHGDRDGCMVCEAGACADGMDAGTDAGVDAGMDTGTAGMDASVDGGVDTGAAGMDASVDSGVDASVDSGVEDASVADADTGARVDAMDTEVDATTTPGDSGGCSVNSSSSSTWWAAIVALVAFRRRRFGERVA